MNVGVGENKLIDEYLTVQDEDIARRLGADA
jgi:hypothetical protein